MSDSPDSINFLLTELSGMVRDLSTELGKVPDQLAELKSDLHSELTTLRTDLMARIDRLQDALTEQRQSDVVTIATADRAERIVKSLQEDNLSLGEQVSALTKLVRRLQTRVDRLEEGRGNPR